HDEDVHFAFDAAGARLDHVGKNVAAVVAEHRRPGGDLQGRGGRPRLAVDLVGRGHQRDDLAERRDEEDVDAVDGTVVGVEDNGAQGDAATQVGTAGRV